MNSCQFNSDVALNLLFSVLAQYAALGHLSYFTILCSRGSLSWPIKYFVIIIFYKDVVTNFHGYNAFFQAYRGEVDARMYVL